MTFLADYIIRKHVPIGQNPELPTFRVNVGINQGWISIFTNLLLFVVKIFFGIISNSIALIADAGFEFLDAPVKRVASKDSPVAYSAVLEDELLVQTSWIEKAVQEITAF